MVELREAKPGVGAVRKSMPGGDAGSVAGCWGGCSRGWSALAAEHGVQKVDVIGDAYLAATNFLAEQTAPPFGVPLCRSEEKKTD